MNERQGNTTNGLCECGCGEQTKTAERTRASRGWIKGKPKRFVAGHVRRQGPVDYLEEDRGHETPCWIWQRALDHGGYGRVNRAGYVGPAHRWYYKQTTGAAPLGDLDHLCRVRACVNPDHLEPVSRAENVRRGKGTKLTREAVQEIRLSPEPNATLADRYGVCWATISRARRTA